MIKPDREYRSRTITLMEEGEPESYVVRGYASTFDPYELFEFDGTHYNERIEPTAFDDADLTDVIFLYNHEGRVFARVKNGTLKVSTDEKGLFSEADLGLSEEGQKLYKDIRSGLIDQMSFAFIVDEDDFEEDGDTVTRVIKRIGKVFDVSAVSIPANPGTDITAVRSAFDGVIEKRSAERRSKEHAEKIKALSEGLDDLTLTDVEGRLAQLDLEEKAAPAELRSMLEAAKTSLTERKAELIDIEERKAAAEALAAGKVKGKVFERKEYKDMAEERTFAVNSVEYRDAYLKQLMGQPMEIEERTALSSAASVIPTMTVNKIYGKLMENPLLAEVESMYIPGYVSVPKATAVYDAAWVAMGNAATDSGDTIGSVSLSAKKLIKTIEITADIRAMSIDAFEGWLVSKLAQKMEAAICAAIIKGDTSATVPEPQGILSAITASSVTSVTLANLGTLMGLLKSAYHKNACFVMSAATFYGKILPLCSDANGVLIANGPEMRLLGHKVVFDENCDVTTTSESGSTTTHNIIFGDLKNYVFNYGEGINIESDQSVAFRSGSTVYRAMALVDGAVCDGEAFVVAPIA